PRRHHDCQGRCSPRALRRHGIRRGARGDRDADLACECALAGHFCFAGGSVRLANIPLRALWLRDCHVDLHGGHVALVRCCTAQSQPPGDRGMIAHNRLAVILMLGTAQTLGWASSFYLPAILGDRIAEDLGISSTWFFAAFSAALVVSAMVGPRAGRTVDAVGGRAVLAASNVILAAGLLVLALAPSSAMLWLAWLILGLGMGIGLYDTAFAALGRIYGLEARSAITGITLLAGFASTVGWPLTAWGASELGWRETCVAWAVAHIVVGLPLNLLLPKSSPVAASAGDNG